MAEIREIISEISDMFTAWTTSYGIAFSPSFNITGGEPFLRKDIFEILGTIKDEGFEMYLLSNGTLINRSTAKLLPAYGIKGVQVSIEGPEHIHDKIRGNGSFSASLKGVRHLLEEGMPVTLNVTLSALNAGSFRETIDLSASIGVQRLGFSRLVPSGRGSALIGSLLTADEIEKLYSRIFSADHPSVELVTGDPIAPRMRTPEGPRKADIPIGGCAAGVSGLTLLADGTIVPCRRLPIPLGNAGRDSIREIWATSAILGKLRDRKSYKGRCGDCVRWADCRGCRAIAYAYSRSRGEDDFLSDDPHCFFRG